MSEQDTLSTDGGTVPDSLIRVRHFAREHWGMSISEAARFFDDAEVAAEWEEVIDHDEEHAADFDLHEYLQEKELCVEDGEAVKWFFIECEMSMEEACDYAPLHFHIPEMHPRAVEKTQNPREWMDLLDRAAEYEDLSGDVEYRVIPDPDEAARYGDTFQFINDWGDVIREDMFDHITEDDAFFPCWIHPEEDAHRLRYNESWLEHAHTLVFVDGTGEKHRFMYRDDVVDAYPQDTSMTPRDREFDEFIRPLLQGSRGFRIDGWRSSHTGPSETTEFVNVGSGWHSSIGRSTQSERINEMTSGECHEEYGWDFPIAVIFSKTSNVMSIGLDIYAPATAAEQVEQHLEGTTPEPRWAGV